MPLPSTLEDLKPGDAIPLANMGELPVFEDWVADQVDPTMTNSQRDAWAGRLSIKELVHPDRFDKTKLRYNGLLTDICVVVMADPYERLFDAIKRGWSFGGTRGASSPSQRATNEEVIKSYRGFTFMATATSSGRGVVGQARSELWYGSVSFERGRVIDDRAYRGQKKTSSHGGSSVQRYVTKPSLDPEAFISLDETSRQIGREVMVHGLQRAVSMRFRN